MVDNLFVIVEFGADTDANSGTGALHFHAGIHKRQAAATNRSHGTGSVGFKDLGDLSHRVGIVVIHRQHWQQ